MKDAILGWLRQRDTQWGVAIAVALSALYAMTLCRVVYWYDSAEFAAHAASLGVPHPPGYPLYTIIAHVFTWLPGEAAFNVNLMSALCGVGAALIVYGLARRLGASAAGSTTGAMILGTSATFWGNAVVAEVYTPGLVFTLGLFVLLERAQTLRRPALVVVAGLGGGLGLGMHMSIATCGLGYAWLVFTYGVDLRRLRDFKEILTTGWKDRVKVLLGSGVAAASGVLIFLYIPLRTFEKWNRREWIIFRKNATGGAFKRKFLKAYDWSEKAEFSLDIFINNLQYVGIGLALVGALVLLRRRPRMAIGLLLAAAGNVYWFFNYEVPDLDVFYLPALAIGSLLCAFSIDGLGRLAARLRPGLLETQWLAMALPAFFAYRNYEVVDLSDVRGAHEYAHEVCAQAESPSRIVLYSSPDEWRYYAVYLYTKKALEACDGIEIWKKPDLREVARAVDRGDTLYAFREVQRLKNRFKLVEEGRLFRLKRRGRARRRPKKRGKKKRKQRG